MEKELAYQIAHAELTKGQVRLAGYILKIRSVCLA